MRNVTCEGQDPALTEALSYCFVSVGTAQRKQKFGVRRENQNKEASCDGAVKLSIVDVSQC